MSKGTATAGPKTNMSTVAKTAGGNPNTAKSQNGGYKK